MQTNIFRDRFKRRWLEQSLSHHNHREAWMNELSSPHTASTILSNTCACDPVQVTQLMRRLGFITFSPAIRGGAMGGGLVTINCESENGGQAHKELSATVTAQRSCPLPTMSPSRLLPPSLTHGGYFVIFPPPWELIRSTPNACVISVGD